MENQKLLNKANSLDKYIAKFKNTPFPKNDSLETYKELMEIKHSMETEANGMAVYKMIDDDVFKYYQMAFEKIGLSLNMELVKQISTWLSPLIMKLKMFYQRPRPFQLAIYTDIELYPFASFPAQAPAYPSGHGGQSYFLCLVMSEFFPEFKDKIMGIADVVAYARIVTGVHFHSDNVFGRYIASEILKTPECKKMMDFTRGNILK
jgi:hypothetical protein